MKILFIYLFLSLGGVECVLKNRHEGFKYLGIKTDFIFLEDHGGASSFETLKDSTMYITNNMDEIEKIIAEGSYDLISVIDTPQVHDILRRIAKNKRVVMEVHTPMPVLREYIKKDIIEGAKATIVPTEIFGKMVESEMKKPCPPIIPIPNPVNNEFFKEVKEVPGHNRIPIAFVGRIESIKDWRESVRILDMVMKKRKDIVFFMIGRTVEDMPEDIYKEFSKRRLMGHLRWIPFIKYEKMPSFYRFIAKNNGIYLSTSKGESFGMTLIESMACNLPIVAYDLPVFREVLEEGKFGRIYSSVKEAAEYILTLIEDKEARENMTKMAYQNALQKYTSRAFALKWKEFIFSGN